MEQSGSKKKDGPEPEKQDKVSTECPVEEKAVVVDPRDFVITFADAIMDNEPQANLTEVNASEEAKLAKEMETLTMTTDNHPNETSGHEEEELMEVVKAIREYDQRITGISVCERCCRRLGEGHSSDCTTATGSPMTTSLNDNPSLPALPPLPSSAVVQQQPSPSSSLVVEVSSIHTDTDTSSFSLSSRSRSPPPPPRSLRRQPGRERIRPIRIRVLEISGRGHSRERSLESLQEPPVPDAPPEHMSPPPPPRRSRERGRGKGRKRHSRNLVHRRSYP